MTERSLKYSCGMFLIGSHIALILFVIWLFFQGGFNIDEFTTVLAVITPMFAGYTTSIAAFVVAERKVHADTSEKVNAAYVGLSFLFPLIFVVLLFIAIQFKAHNQVFDDFETLKRFLLIVESLFAAYVGLFVYSMFEKKPPVGVVADRGSQPVQADR